jgi:hypothetical protein
MTHSYIFDVHTTGGETRRINVRSADYPHAESIMLAHVGPHNIDRDRLWTLLDTDDPTVEVTR